MRTKKELKIGRNVTFYLKQEVCEMLDVIIESKKFKNKTSAIENLITDAYESMVVVETTNHDEISPEEQEKKMEAIYKKYGVAYD